jgi:hypothetical protein
VRLWLSCTEKDRAVGHRPMSHTEGGGAQAIVGSGWRQSHMSGFDRRLGPSAMVLRSGIREIGRQGVFAKIPNHRGGVFSKICELRWI